MSSNYFKMNTGSSKSSEISFSSSGGFLGCFCSCMTFCCICLCCLACLIGGIVTFILVALYVDQTFVLGSSIVINRQAFEVAAFNVTTSPDKFYIVTKLAYGMKNTASREMIITQAQINVYYKETKVGSANPHSRRHLPAGSELKPNLEIDLEIENTELPIHVMNDMRQELQITKNLKLTFQGSIGVIYHYGGNIPILTFEESIQPK
eukprot:gene9600-1802_t